ncbi:MAG: hypothetical protein GY814_14480, partial [Gammaproteobacteria bacterium]|nr:hypothetical protein [Gammaproteobacteria bacterium]
MTVENTNNTISYTGNGSSKTFAYDYLVYSTSHLKVYLDEVLQTVGYTVTDIGQDDGGNVVFSSAPSSGVEITLTRIVPYTQLVEYQEYGPFPAKTTERALDLLTMSASQLGADLAQANSRSLKVADNDPVLASGLVIPTNRFDKLLSFDIDGNVKLVTFDEDAADRAEASAGEAAASANEAEASANLTNSLYLNFRDDYAGHGPNLPQGENDGTLFYYDGPNYTQGLYITYASNSDPFTGTWNLVSGVGPQGPQGPQGVQGAEGIQGPQGIQGVEGEQGQQGIQGSIGDTGPAGIKGETGSQGQQGPQGVAGPSGPVGPQGVQGGEGPQGAVGSQGPQGAVGPQGDSFQVDQVGLLSDRVNFDAEPKGFSYLATDSQQIDDQEPGYTRFIGDGVETSFDLSFIPDGEQSLVVLLAGVQQGPDSYAVSVTTAPDLYTVTFSVPVPLGVSLLVRGYSVSTGYGEIFFKESNSSGDWSSGLPFGRGPRGDQGPQGVEGVQGPQGQQGTVGPQGDAGPQGLQGIDGPQGPEGDVGPQGQEGPAGERGPDGVQGAEGPRGTTGPQGKQGITGAVGPQGPQGPVGAQGARGDVGARGPTGPRGDKGVTGDDGADGRSSSGKLYSGVSSIILTSTGFKTYFTIDILESKPFDRTIKVSNIGIVGATGAGIFKAQLSIQHNQSGNTGRSGPISVTASEYGMLTPAFVDIPANNTGIVTVRCQTLVASINGAMYAGGTERGTNDA